MGIIKDLISDQAVSRDSEGYSAERAYMVEVPGGTMESKLYDAIKTAGIPQYADAHPILPDVSVTNISARPTGGGSPNTIRVQVTYSIPAADDADADPEEDETIDGSVSMSTSLASEKTYFDINNDFLTVKWIGGTVVTKYASADVQRPELSVTFRRIETSLPRANIIKYLGKVNSVPWSGFPSKTWLCVKIDCTEEKEGRFDVDYGFSYKEESWRLEVVANLTEEQINELPPNTETANGFQVYDVYHDADFNQLGLAF